jgi:hypothetical protein
MAGVQGCVLIPKKMRERTDSEAELQHLAPISTAELSGL